MTSFSTTSAWVPGAPASSPVELAYTYERGLKVLPSFGVIAASQSLLDLFGHEAFDAELSQILHGEQGPHDPCPPADGRERPRHRARQRRARHG